MSAMPVAIMPQAQNCAEQVVPLPLQQPLLFVVQLQDMHYMISPEACT